MTRTIIKLLILVFVLVVSRLVSDAGEAPHVLRLDDFEDGDLRAPNGLSWIVLGDDLVGGESKGRMEVVTRKVAASRSALRFTGRRSGARSFVGVWVPLEGEGRPLALGAFDGIRMRVKSTVPLLAGFRVGSFNYMAPIEAGEQWRVAEIPFDRLRPQGQVPEGTRFDPSAVAWFGVTTPYVLPGEVAPASDVVFEIDDVEITGRAGALIAPFPAGSESAGPVSLFPFTPLTSIPTEGWSELATDPEGDATATRLPDVTRLEVRPAAADGMMWFRMTLREPPHGRWMGVNLALDEDDDPKNGQPWWGANKEFRFDRIVTVYCFPVAGGCQGMVGIVDADQAATGTLWGGGEGLRFAIDQKRRAFVVGVPRAALHLGPGANRLVAAVGSALFFGDDVPSQGAALLQ